jgi:hypothetical protein
MDKDEIRTTLLDEVLPVAATTENWEQVLALQEFNACDENEFLFYRPLSRDGNRYLITFDVGRFHDQTKQRQRQNQHLEQMIQSMNEALRTAKKSRKREIVEREVHRILSRKGLKKQTR